jgi:hypothetical protein
MQRVGSPYSSLDNLVPSASLKLILLDVADLHFSAVSNNFNQISTLLPRRRLDDTAFEYPQAQCAQVVSAHGSPWLRSVNKAQTENRFGQMKGVLRDKRTKN